MVYLVCQVFQVFKDLLVHLVLRVTKVQMVIPVSPALLVLAVILVQEDLLVVQVGMVNQV